VDEISVHINKMGDVENRYKALIQPIRDLAQNWDVDVAEELTDYLHQLYNFDIRTNTKGLNFAEAALLIQGSAAVYGRKVEYLHQLVLHALDLFAHQKGDKNGSVATGPGSQVASSALSFLDDERFLFGSDEAYLLLDDLIEEGVNITVDAQAEKALLKERRRTSAGRTSQSADTSRASMILMHSILQEDHGGSNLKLSSCRMDTSGALLMAGIFNSANAASTNFPNVSIISDGHLQKLNDSVCGFGSDNMLVDEDIAPHWQYDDNDDDNGGPSFDNGAGDAPASEDLAGGTLQTVCRSPPRRVGRCQQGQKKQMAGPSCIDLLDSHEVLTTSRPISKGKTFRIPSHLPPLGGRQDLRTSRQPVKNRKELSPSSVFQSLLKGKVASQGITHPHFQFIVKKQRQAVSAARLANRWAMNDLATEEPEARNSEQGMAWNFDVADDDDNDYFGREEEKTDTDPGVPVEDFLCENLGAVGSDNFSVPFSTSDAVETEEEWLARRVEQALSEELVLSQNVTYESLCRRHIDSFMLGAEKYARYSNVSCCNLNDQF
jgi:hypothetical protein